MGCMESRNKSELIRVVRSPEGEISLDLKGKKSGRGAYICPSAECLKKAKKTKGLDRSFKMAVSEEVYDSLTKEIEIFESEQKYIK